MIQQQILDRKLPAVLPEGMTAEGFAQWRSDMKELFARECFGKTPAAPEQVRAEVLEEKDPAWCGKAVCKKIRLSFDMEKGEFSFPMHLSLPKAGQPSPCVVYISFSETEYAGRQPIEEILDMGWAYASFVYEDVTSDDGDMQNGIAAMTSRTDSAAWGKLGMWAYAASRVMDYLSTCKEIDPSRVIVVGLSRLGKAALWAGTQDERFAGTVSVNSGCSGAAVCRGKVGETVDDICRVFPFWFCENYQKYRRQEDALPFDQYHLLALCAPRLLYVTSSSEDEWADPRSEYLSCRMLDAVYALFGQEALGGSAPDCVAPDGRIAGERVGYHLRPGTHGISRYDWVRLMRFMAQRL